MKKNIALLTIVLLLFAGNDQAIASVPDNLPQSPNIVFIMVDDLGWGDIRAFNPDSKLVLPTIDQLAAEGRVFYDAHSPAAVCAPSRYATITGNYTWRGQNEWGIWDYYGYGSQILQGQWSIGDILKQAGYTTGIIGKYHLGGHVTSSTTGEVAFWSDDDSTLDLSKPMLDGPRDHGFDYSFLNLTGTQAPPYAFFENDMLVGNVGDLIDWVPGEYGDSVIDVGGIGLSTWDTTEIEKTSLEQAVQFIQQSNNATPKSPFFLYLPLVAIHQPHTPPIDIVGFPVRGESDIGNKGDMIHAVDVVVHQILATLEAEGILNETLIIFTSDNGSLTPLGELAEGHDGSGGLRGSKTLIFEGGHRVPLIVKWGDGSQLGSFVPVGSSSDTLIGVQDFTAILAQLAGVKLPQDQARDSFNMTSALFANSNDGQLQRDHLLTISNRDFSGAVLPRNEYYYAIRDGEWKLIVHYKQSEPDNVVAVGLFDLSNDLKETTDLVNDPLQFDRVQALVDKFKFLHATPRTAPIFVFDLDGDAVADDTDNCKLDYNDNQLDTDADNLGDVCDTDDDSDGISDVGEVSAGTNPLLADTDNDGVLDGADIFPLDANESVDTDGDGVGNNADTDDDGDGVIDSDDDFPLDTTRSVAESGSGDGGGAVSLLGLGLLSLIGLARRKKA